MEWSQQSLIMDESFPVEFLLDSQLAIGQASASNLHRDRRRSFPVLTHRHTEKHNLRATLSAIEPHLELDEDTTEKTTEKKDEQNETPLSSKMKQNANARQRSQSKDSGDSYRTSRQRKVVTFRQRSKSEVDFKAINRKKYAHVKSKVKQHILQLESENKRPLVVKQKSMPELQRSKKLVSASPEESGNQSNYNDSGMMRQDSTNSIPNSTALELEEKERVIQELSDYVTMLETNCKEKMDENYTLKKKVEQMRDKINQFSERRASVPALNSGAISFYESQFDSSPFSSIGTPVRRVIKQVVSKSIQTSFRDDHHPYLDDRSDVNRGDESDCPQIKSSPTSDTPMRRSKSEVMVNKADSTEPDTPKTAPLKYLSDENFRRDKSFLEKSRSSVHRFHVSFRSNNSYKIFDETTAGTVQGLSDATESSDVVVNKKNSNNVQKEKKLSILRKFLNCFRSKKNNQF